jgi:hypothetical protein
MKIKLNITPIKILKDDNAKLYFSHDESGHWINVIEANYGNNIAERMHVILIELLENAVFHNNFEDSDINYEIEIVDNHGYIRVTNKVSLEQYSFLSNIITKYAKSESLENEYARAMENNEEGGLGLLRLMTEQECKLRIYKKYNDYIQIEARIEL